MDVKIATFTPSAIDHIKLPYEYGIIHIELGGPATYFAVGGRLFLGSPYSKFVGWAFRCGESLREDMMEDLLKWNTQIEFQPRTHRCGADDWRIVDHGDYKAEHERPFVVHDMRRPALGEDPNKHLRSARVVHVADTGREVMTTMELIESHLENMGIEKDPLFICELSADHKDHKDGHN
ncbi:MAG: hypothetical protein MMC23_002467 [Stictis urceolatum]|nr:hypothetical protein [Stictis urceolata]